MDNEKKQRLEETLMNFENDMLDRMFKYLSDMEARIQQQFAEVDQKLDGVEQVIRELARSKTDNAASI